MLYIGADHRGYKLKEQLKSWLKTESISVEDVGAFSYDKNDDYPLVAASLAERVGASEDNKGILLCGSGVGASAAANKRGGIRAAIGISPEQVADCRHDDDMNMLVVAADHTHEDGVRAMVQAFLKTDFDEGSERYQRRISQIRSLESE